MDVDGRLYVLRATNGTGNRVLKQFDFDKNRPMAQPLVQVPDFDFNGGLLHDPRPAGCWACGCWPTGW